MTQRPDQDIPSDRGLGRHRLAPHRWSMLAFSRPDIPAKTRRHLKLIRTELRGEL